MPGLTRRSTSTLACVAAAAICLPAYANPGGTIFKAELIGYEEVPAVSSPGSGVFQARALPSGQGVQWSLYFSGLQGTPTQAHIHIGQHGVAGGIAVWLCGSATNPGPAGTQACIQGTEMTGVISAQNVVGPNAQLVAAGEVEEVVRAMQHGVAYVNVHSNLVGSGEIRGQVR